MIWNRPIAYALFLTTGWLAGMGSIAPAWGDPPATQPADPATTIATTLPATLPQAQPTTATLPDPKAQAIAEVLQNPHWITDRDVMWERGDNLLWNFHHMYQFEVLHEPEDAEYPFKAWFCGRPVEDDPTSQPLAGIFAARSRRLDSGWEVYAGPDPEIAKPTARWNSEMNPAGWHPVAFEPGDQSIPWQRIDDPSVIKVEKRYYLAFSIQLGDRDQQEDDRPAMQNNPSVMMGAVSDDGIHWQCAKKPILIDSPKREKKTRARDEKRRISSIRHPALLQDDGKFKLWFEYDIPNGQAMGYAENKGDFMNPRDWKIVRAGPNPCLYDFPHPDVVKIDALYYAFGDPLRYGTNPHKGRRLTEAVSPNGLDWIVVGHVAPDPDALANRIPQALTLRADGHHWLYVFYANQTDDSDDETEDVRMTRIRHLRRPLSTPEQEYYSDLCQRRLNAGTKP